jgi:hypothetical protein
MINIIAPPGCYGTYVARCLHHYTSSENNYRFKFDQAGSSHVFRTVSSETKKTSLAHWIDEEKASINKETTVVITPDDNHQLDYYDNQYYKQSLGNLTEYLTENLGIDKIQKNLEKGWNYKQPFGNDTPKWIIREYCSFCLIASWENGYDTQKYLALPHVYDFCCEELWNTSMWDLVNTLADVLKLKVYAPNHTVNKNHSDFLNCQRYHNMQKRCEQFVNDTINSIDAVSPCVSIFDEAYVQCVLRSRGYEISCDGLETFPKSSNTLSKIIYETSNNHT